MQQPLKIAIVRLSAMGDIIHSASVLPLFIQSLKMQYSITLHWYVDTQFAEILHDMPYIDKCIAIPLKQSLKNKDLKQLKEIYNTLKSASTYDFVLDMQGLLKSAILAKLLKSKCVIGFESPRESFAKFFYTKTIPIAYKEHILLRNATLLFGAFNKSAPDLEALKSNKVFLGFTPQSLPQLPKGKKILFVLETSKANKTYPLESFLELALLFNAKNYTPIFITRNAIQINNPKNVQFLSLYNLNLTQVKQLVSQMDLVIGGDTGITHLSWAFHRPSITLYGATPQKRINVDTNINKSLSANSNANDDKNDFSIRTLQAKEILELANTLLETSKA